MPQRWPLIVLFNVFAYEWVSGGSEWVSDQWLRSTMQDEATAAFQLCDSEQPPKVLGALVKWGVILVPPGRLSMWLREIMHVKALLSEPGPDRCYFLFYSGTAFHFDPNFLEWSLCLKILSVEVARLLAFRRWPDPTYIVHPPGSRMCPHAHP